MQCEISLVRMLNELVKTPVDEIDAVVTRSLAGLAVEVRADWACLFRLDGDRLVPMIHGVVVANGLAFSPDGRTLYAVTNPTRRVEAFDLDPGTGALSNRRVFLELGDGEGFTDGATVDSEGGYWLACGGTCPTGRWIASSPCLSPTRPSRLSAGRT